MRTRFASITILLGLGIAVMVPRFLSGQQNAPVGSEGLWTVAQVLHPEDLARTLKNQPGTPPKVFNVGFAVLYNSKHIPGSVYAGPGSKDEGLTDLKRAVAAIPKDGQMVLYCGCWPMDRCPNLRPAFKLLRDLGFKQIKVVEIPTNFNTDWIEKGFPVEGATATTAPVR
jgi:hypothetical protein